MKLYLDYYLASRRPRIVLYGGNQAPFWEFYRLVIELSRTPGLTFDLDTQPFVELRASVSLRMVSLRTGKSMGVRRRHLKHDAPSSSFDWSDTPQYWDDTAAQILPFVENGNIGHHYLGGNANQDAEFVLSHEV